jgi:NAD(P)-dependent dehydrogenase (short-subunit alcohol dehydrogenase family)
MSSERVAVVTGANKGIGYGVVQCLAHKFDGIVYLTGIVFTNIKSCLIN